MSKHPSFGKNTGDGIHNSGVLGLSSGVKPTAVRTTTTFSSTYNNDGKLDLKLLREKFDEQDTNYDGKIDKESFGKIVAASTRDWNLRFGVNSDEIFKSVDTDSDGLINFSQFIEGINKCQLY
jgi:Ca2+-binding EF-hand superfamily protein